MELDGSGGVTERLVISWVIFDLTLTKQHTQEKNLYFQRKEVNMFLHLFTWRYKLMGVVNGIINTFTWGYSNLGLWEVWVLGRWQLGGLVCSNPNQDWFGLRFKAMVFVCGFLWQGFLLLLKLRALQHLALMSEVSISIVVTKHVVSGAVVLCMI